MSLPGSSTPAAGRPTLGLNLPYVEGDMDGATPRWSDLLAMAREGEAMGFDAAWIADHVGFGDPDGEWHGAWDSWTLLSALAGALSRIRLGNYVLAMPYRNPALVAKMATTLDEVSGGRLTLGLGAGWNKPEFDAFGFPWERRFDRFEEGLRVVTSMLRTGRADLDGAHVTVRGARIEPRGARPLGPQVMVGAGGPRMLRLTAQHADAWNGGMRSPASLAAMLPTLDEACRAVGRDPLTLARSVEAMVATSAAPPAGPEAEAAAPDELGSWSRPLRGDPATIAAGLRRYGELGVDHVQVQLRPNSIAGVRAFAPVMEAYLARD